LFVRKKLVHGLFALFSAICLFAGLPAYPVTVDSTDISNRAYYPAVLNEINNAKQEIDVAMYAMYVRYAEPDNPAYKLVAALIDAHARGAKVTVYLDKSSINGDGEGATSSANDAAYKMLQDAGITVYFVKPEFKLHAKLIVVDRETVIEGSSNWTQKAIDDNFESDTLTRGEDFARQKIEFFTALTGNVVAPVAPDPAIVEKVKIRNSFLENTKLAPQMVRVGSEHAFQLYLWLLRREYEAAKSAAGSGEWHDLGYVEAAQYLGIKVDTVTSNYRNHVRDTLDPLKNEYKLIDYRPDNSGNLQVRLLDYDDPAKGYTPPTSGYFNLPLAYWEYGLDKQLRLREKFSYLVSIYEQETARPRLWWRRSLIGLEQKYHINWQEFCDGLRELERQDLIEVHYSRTKGKNYSERDPNEYRVKELIAPKVKEQMWQELGAAEGVEMVKAARQLAVVLNQENNIQTAKDFIRLIKQYTLENVEEAVRRIADYTPDNPRKNIGYIVGVLKQMAKEK